MKRYLWLSILISSILISPLSALAAGDHDVSVEDVVGKIRQAQGVVQNSDIECGEISDEQFEELGEAAMSLMHPDTQEHEMMDAMMGGEGSQSLETAHIMMGQQYIGCASDSSGMLGSSGMMGNMMMGGMMGGGMMNNSPLKNWGGGGNMMNMIGIVWLIKNLISQDKNYEKEKKSKAMEILKERYARSEISKAEFERIKKDINF